MSSKPKMRTADLRAERANEPGVYECPRCGERLSGPPELYEPCWCKVPVESLGRDE